MGLCLLYLLNEDYEYRGFMHRFRQRFRIALVLFLTYATAGCGSSSSSTQKSAPSDGQSERLGINSTDGDSKTDDISSWELEFEFDREDAVALEKPDLTAIRAEENDNEENPESVVVRRVVETRSEPLPSFANALKISSTPIQITVPEGVKTKIDVSPTGTVDSMLQTIGFYLYRFPSEDPVLGSGGRQIYPREINRRSVATDLVVNPPVWTYAGYEIDRQNGELIGRDPANIPPLRPEYHAKDTWYVFPIPLSAGPWISMNGTWSCEVSVTYTQRLQD